MFRNPLWTSYDLSNLLGGILGYRLASDSFLISNCRLQILKCISLVYITRFFLEAIEKKLFSIRVLLLITYKSISNNKKQWTWDKFPES